MKTENNKLPPRGSAITEIQIVWSRKGPLIEFTEINLDDDDYSDNQIYKYQCITENPNREIVDVLQKVLGVERPSIYES